MTEMCSQFYDDDLRRTVLGLPPTSTRIKTAPPWVLTTVVDPETLSLAPRGSTGLLRHIDLANLFSVSAIQTEDVGELTPGGFILHGRAAGAPPRGCSIALDMLMQAARERQ
jgi:hypothetical protein